LDTNSTCSDDSTFFGDRAQVEETTPRNEAQLADDGDQTPTAPAEPQLLHARPHNTVTASSVSPNERTLLGEKLDTSDSSIDSLELPPPTNNNNNNNNRNEVKKAEHCEGSSAPPTQPEFVFAKPAVPPQRAPVISRRNDARRKSFAGTTKSRSVQDPHSQQPKRVWFPDDISTTSTSSSAYSSTWERQMSARQPSKENSTTAGTCFWTGGRNRDVPKTNPYCTLSRNTGSRINQPRTQASGCLANIPVPNSGNFNHFNGFVHTLDPFVSTTGSGGFYSETPKCRLSPIKPQGGAIFLQNPPFSTNKSPSKDPKTIFKRPQDPLPNVAINRPGWNGQNGHYPEDSSSDSSVLSSAASSIYCTMSRRIAREWNGAVESAIARQQFMVQGASTRVPRVADWAAVAGSTTSGDDSSSHQEETIDRADQNNRKSVNRLIRSLKSLRIGGQIYLSIVATPEMLTVSIDEARNLYMPEGPSVFNSYVKMFLQPNGSSRTCCKTNIILNSRQPVFNQTFSMELLPDDLKKRLLVSTWHKDIRTDKVILLGCMTFNLRTLVAENKQIEGWYYLLGQHVGRKKHMRVDNVRFTTYYGSVDSGLNNDLHQPEVPNVWL
jgi:hypothetical protein